MARKSVLKMSPAEKAQLRPVWPGETSPAKRAEYDHVAERKAYWASRPAARIRALQVGESVLIASYLRPRQISSTVASLSKKEGRQFTTKRQDDLVWGMPEGILVTRIK